VFEGDPATIGVALTPLDGSKDIARAAHELAVRLPSTLAPLADLAFNYWWSWTPGGVDLFRQIDPDRFDLCRENPVRFLQEAPSAALARVARDHSFVERAETLREGLRSVLEAEPDESAVQAEHPVAFLCLEYGIHPSLPIYSGGLGILAGDILKESSDRALPLVGVGILYSQGSYHQRLDPDGWQHDYWVDTEPEFLPAALVTGEDGSPLTVTVPIRGRDVVAAMWRVDVGRVPLFLLDTNRPENDAIDRWITSRLYLSDPKIRLAQYAMLGMAGIRALRAVGIDPGLVHMNEGHPGLAPLELAAQATRDGRAFDDAMDEVRQKTIFTTHTPVPAGNETYPPEVVLDVVGAVPAELGVDPDRFIGLGAIDESRREFGMTTLALRLARFAGGVSRRHEEVARSMWAWLYPGREPSEVPIGHVTNGVHLPTWMAPAMRELLDRYLGEGWTRRASDPDTWGPVAGIPDEELWEVRNHLRARLVSFVWTRSALDRLARGESSDSVEMAREVFDPDALTIGFARRVALYKRLYLLIHDPERADRLLEGRPVQVILAGKAHPDDHDAKQSLKTLFEHRWGRRAGLRVTYLEDYGLALAHRLVSGCDLWLNLPRPPLEASGTSGMKSALNGGLNLSVPDGWWAEAFDGTNGWAFGGATSDDHQRQDAEDARDLYDLVEREVIPLFYDRGEDGIPHGWLARVKASLRSIGPRFCAARMMDDYTRIAYRVPAERAHS
jgi:starch phosphorylase